MHYFDYREKLGIGFDDQERVEKFKNMLENEILINRELDSHIADLLSAYDFDARKFFNSLGIDLSRINNVENIVGILFSALKKHKDNIKEYISVFVLFMNCIGKEEKKKEYREIITESLQYTGIEYEIIEDDDGYFIFPGGAKELNNVLVSETLDWLIKYPATRSVYTKALEMYSDLSTYDARTVADQFRKTLEAFFQEFFSSTKTLENLKSEYRSFLIGKGIPKEISGNIETLMQAYTNYMNNYVKHRDRANNQVLEYIMYQTGNIIRLMIKLNEA